MDKLKLYLAAAKKHQFWICCGVMVLASLASWWLAAGELEKKFADRKGQIEGSFSDATVSPGSPNQACIDAISKVDPGTNQDSGALGKLKPKVYDAWEALYAEQKRNNSFPTKLLGEDFRKAFESLQLPKDQLDSGYLERYQNHIEEYLPSLQEIVKVRREVEKKEGTAPGAAPPPPRRPPSTPRGRGPVGGMMPGGAPRGPLGPAADSENEYTGIVDWDDADFARLTSHFTNWPGGAPTTLEVAMAQEDLWVYEALLRMIRKVNQGATSQANAPIKRIAALGIGKDSKDAWDDARKAVFTGGKGGPAPVASGASGSEAAVFENRYVDDKGQYLPYDPVYPHAKHPMPEFKMMPVYMDFVMDQRRLPMLLVECANCSMPIEVRLVRVLRETVSPFDPANAASGTSAPTGPRPTSPRPLSPLPMRGRSGGPGGMGIGGMGPPRRPDTGPSPNVAAADTSGQVDVPVQVYGIIYIYNPPDCAKLGVQEKNRGGATPAVGAPATPPASTPGK